MALIRLMFLLLAGAALLSLLMHRLTGQSRWRQRGVGLLKWLGVGLVMLLVFLAIRRGAVFV